MLKLLGVGFSREGRFGLGQEEQDEDQGFGGEHAEGGLLSVPVS